MTCSIESAIIAEAAPKKYARNTGRRSAGKETAELTRRKMGSDQHFRSRRFAVRTGLLVELGIAAKDALLVERDAALGAEISGEPRALHHPVVQRHQFWILGLKPFHRLREGVAQSLDHLEERELHVRNGLAALGALEIVEELR